MRTDQTMGDNDSHDNRCQYCEHQSDDGHHYALLIRGDWYWGCADVPNVEGADGTVRIGHRVGPQDIRLRPNALDLLRDAAGFYCGELPDGTDRREAIRKLIEEIDRG